MIRVGIIQRDPERGMDAAVEVVIFTPQNNCVFSMSNRIQTTALTVLSGGAVILARLMGGTAAEAAPGYSHHFSHSERQQEIQRQNADNAAAKAKGQAAHQSIQSGGSASPTKDGYGGMNKGEKEAYKAGFRGE